MPLGYKYAERDADSQVNWAEVGKGLSDMLAETNRVRQEKKDALDTAQRETMNYLAETPNGEHVGARQSILEYANMASNQMRIMKQLMEQGQLDVKDYTIFRQNLTDNTNLAFNANKVFQEKWSDVMQGVRDKKYSQLYADNFAEVQEFGNWKNIGWQITPNGTVMAGKMIEQEVDGKKVRTLDKTPGGLRSMDYLNQTMVSQVDFYNYEDKVNAWVDTLGKNTEVSTMLGRIGAQGLSRSLEDVTKKKYAKQGDMEVEYKFIQSEDDQIATIVGDPLDAARVLVDSAIFAPNQKQYRTTTSEEDAKKNPEAILKVVDPETGGFKYVISKEQQKDVNEFVRTQMRAKYDKIEKEDVINQVNRDEKRPPNPDELKRADDEKKAANAASMIGKLYYGNNNEVNSAIDYFKGIKDDKGQTLFKDFIRDSGGITVTLANGETERISFLDANNKPRTQEDFIRSAGPLLAGQLDINTALNKGSYKKGATFNRTSSGRSTTETGKERYANYLRETLKPYMIGLSEEKVVPVISKLASGYGLEAVESGAGNYITINVPGPNGTNLDSREFSLKESDPATQKDILDDIIEFMSSNAINTDKVKAKGKPKGTVQGGRTR